MRGILIFFIFGFSCLSSENIDVKKILKDIEELEREKRLFSKIVVKYDPFFPKKKRKERKTVFKKKRTYKLKAVLNDKAFINDRWFGLGEKVGEYRIVKITPSFVILKKGERRKVIGFSSKSLLKTKDSEI